MLGRRLVQGRGNSLSKGLERADLVQSGQGRNRSYNLGPRLGRHLHAAADDGWITALARPHLKELVETSGETCYLTRIVGRRVLVAVSVSPEVRWRGYVQPGIEMLPHAAATAKAIMAFQGASLIEQVLSETLPKFTANTRTDTAWIESEFAKVRERNYATCIGEIDEGLAALAVPIKQPDGQVLHALGVTGPLQRIMDDSMPERINALQQTASKLESALSLGASITKRNGG
ncbi:IclR family transcriptional regulator [Microvirga sp. 2YAF29]|uniref:IclR family transcriptional regulator n=1 Tax=Microvirga sp. 2YAF29 TaxID=3233031 RepID=UPI003F9C536D